MDEKQAYKKTDELVVDIENLNKPPLRKWMSKIYDSMKLAAGVAAAMGVGALLTYTLATRSPQSNTPSQFELMRSLDYSRWAMDSLSSDERNYMWSILYPKVGNLRYRSENIMKGSGNDKLYDDYNLRFFEIVHHISQRLATGLLMGLAVSDTSKYLSEYNGSRFGLTYIPNDFFMWRNREFPLTKRDGTVDIPQQIALSAMYVKGCIGQSRDVGDVYARYFCSPSEIFSAQVKTSSMNYMPRVDSTGDIKKGYREMLSYKKRDLIDNAIFFHMISDEEGHIDWNNVPNMIPRPSYGREYSEMNAFFIASR